MKGKDKVALLFSAVFYLDFYEYVGETLLVFNSYVHLYIFHPSCIQACSRD